MLTIKDLQEIEGRATQLYTNSQSRCRLEGMNRDLNAAEIRVLAFYEASITQANSKLGEKRLNDGELREIFNTVYQKVQETVEGEEMTFNLKAQG
jgi:hypothetical protein